MSETQKKKIGLAVTSLVFGCLFLVPILNLLCSPIALILGIVALVKANKNKDIYGGKGLAISGIVLGGIGIVFSFIGILLTLIAIPQFVKVKHRAQENEAQSVLKSVVAACQVYRLDQGSYPENIQDLSAKDHTYLDTSMFGKDGKYNYSFKYSANNNSFNVSAQPINESENTRNFVVNETGQVYVDADKDGIAGSPGDTLAE